MGEPITTTIESAIEAAQEINQRVRKMIPGGHEHLSSVAETRNLSDDLMHMVGAAERLKGKNAESVLAETIKRYGLKQGTELKGAAAFLRMRISEVSEQLEKMAKGHRNSWEGLTASAAAAKRRKPGSGHAGEYAGGAVKQYERWMESASHGQRMAFGAGCIGVGSLCMYIGGEWLAQAFYGRGMKKTAASDELGNPATVTIPAHLSSVERVLKGALGTSGLAAGFVGISTGLSHMLHGR